MSIPDIKLVPCPIVKDKITPFYCGQCFFHGKEFCKQYQDEIKGVKSWQVKSKIRAKR